MAFLTILLSTSGGYVSAQSQSIIPIHRDDIFVSRLAPSTVAVPDALIDLFLAHRRGKFWKETSHCTRCKRKVLTTIAAEQGGKCGHCRLGRIRPVWDHEKARTYLEASMRSEKGALFVAWGHVQSAQPILIGFVQVSVVGFNRLSAYLGYEVLHEVGVLLGRREDYVIIDNLVVSDASYDDTTALALVSAVIRHFEQIDRVRLTMLTLVGNATLYEQCLAQRNFRLCKHLPDSVLLMGRA
jgi:hypothetical protein